jgi:hypothetical protein
MVERGKDWERERVCGRRGGYSVNDRAQFAIPLVKGWKLIPSDTYSSHQENEWIS